MDQSVGFVDDGRERKVCRFKREFYGLKQAPVPWLNSYLREN